MKWLLDELVERGSFIIVAQKSMKNTQNRAR